MKKSSLEDRTFEHVDFTTEPFVVNEFEYCAFIHCNFSGVDLSDFRFVDCRFSDCDVSNAKLQKTTLNDVRFSNCKLLGLHFEDCSEFLFTVSFERCIIDFSSFYGRSLKKSVFKNCSLQQVDFTDADLTGSSFEESNLLNAVFENTVLEKVDFRSAVNFIIDPEKNRVKKAKFDRLALAGLLTRYDIQIS